MTGAPQLWLPLMHQDACDVLHAMVGCLLTCLQFGVAKALRTLVVYVLSAASFTMNLPPMSAAPRLWEGLGVRLG